MMALEIFGFVSLAVSVYLLVKFTSTFKKLSSIIDKVVNTNASN